MSDLVATAELNDRLWDCIGTMAFGFMGLLRDAPNDVPMTVHKHRDDTHALWIFTTRDGPIAAAGPASFKLVSKGQDVFARLEGSLAHEHDRQILDDLWSRQVAAWYPRGKDDPNLLFLRFDLGLAEVWLADMSLWTFTKMMVGANIHDEMSGKHGVTTPG